MFLSCSKISILHSNIINYIVIEYTQIKNIPKQADKIKNDRFPISLEGFNVIFLVKTNVYEIVLQSIRNIPKQDNHQNCDSTRT